MSIRLTLKDDESVVNKRRGLRLYKALVDVHKNVIQLMHFFENVGLRPKVETCINAENTLIEIMRHIESDYSLEEEDTRCF